MYALKSLKKIKVQKSVVLEPQYAGKEGACEV